MTKKPLTGLLFLFSNPIKYLINPINIQIERRSLYEYVCTDTPGIENTHGWYIIWGQLNVNDGINGGTDLD